MNILMATSEAIPFAKTGGLADVAGTLPIELARQGVRPCVMMPAYREAMACGQPFEPLDMELSIPIGSKTVKGGLLKSCLPNSEVPVYLVRHDDYYDRPGLYQENGEDYIDNCERFVFFCRAVMESIRLLELEVDVLHANDWPTGLIPAYLRTEYSGVPGYEQIASLFTIHNLAYQGRFWHWDMLLTGLDWKYFNWHQMEYYGDLNLMKTGLVFSDALSTVSRRYAEEIQSAPLGCGLEGVLQSRRDVLAGIVNGVDYSIWNPATDPHLAARYEADSVADGKPACKAALQQELGLAQRADVPLIGFVGRLALQKGIDLVAGVIQQWAQESDVQWVLLGTGDPDYQATLESIASRFPNRIAVRIGFSEDLAHRIEAGADMFLMPSQYEPSGLNQLYSLKYGTVPVVRATGGLADTIVHTTDETLADGTANGFSFRDYSVLALSEVLRQACDRFADRDAWRQLVETGMRQDWSWSRSAREYVALYSKTVSALRQKVRN